MEGRPDRPIPPEIHKELVKKFDKDGDGKLNDEERQAAKDEIRRLKEEGKLGENVPPEVKERIKERLDTDGDGKISPEERQKAKERRKNRKGTEEAPPEGGAEF